MKRYSTQKFCTDRIPTLLAPLVVELSQPTGQFDRAALVCVGPRCASPAVAIDDKDAVVSQRSTDLGEVSDEFRPFMEERITEVQCCLEGRRWMQDMAGPET